MLAGAYAISALIKQKLDVLKGPEGLNKEIDEAKKCSEAFTKKLQDSNADLGKHDATDENAKRAILKTHANEDKGAKELKALLKSVESLAKAAKAASSNSVKELTSPVVAESPKKP